MGAGFVRPESWKLRLPRARGQGPCPFAQSARTTIFAQAKLHACRPSRTRSFAQAAVMCTALLRPRKCANVRACCPGPSAHANFHAGCTARFVPCAAREFSQLSQPSPFVHGSHAHVKFRGSCATPLCPRLRDCLRMPSPVAHVSRAQAKSRACRPSRQRNKRNVLCH